MVPCSFSRTDCPHHKTAQCSEYALCVSRGQRWDGFCRNLSFWGPGLCRTVSGNGDDVLVIGKVGPGRTAKAVTQAVISKVKDEHPEAPGILPTYALSGSLTQKNVRSAVRQALLLAKHHLPECLPDWIMRKKASFPAMRPWKPFTSRRPWKNGRSKKTLHF